MIASPLFWSQVTQVAIIADMVVMTICAGLYLALERRWPDLSAFLKEIALLALLTLVALMFGYGIVGIR